LSVTVSFFTTWAASSVAFLLRDVSHKATSGNNLTASTRDVAQLNVALRSPHANDRFHLIVCDEPA